MVISVICFAAALVFGFSGVNCHIDRCADETQLLLDGIIDRLNKLEEK